MFTSAKVCALVVKQRPVFILMCLLRSYVATISYKNHGVSGSDNPTDTNLALYVVQAVSVLGGRIMLNPLREYIPLKM